MSSKRSLNGLVESEFTSAQIDDIECDSLIVNNTTANKWLKTDNDKKIISTNEIPVLTTGDQTIAGYKTFTDRIKTDEIDTVGNNDLIIRRNSSQIGEITESGIELLPAYKFYGDLIGTSFWASKLKVPQQIAGHTFNGTQHVVIASSDLSDGNLIILSTDERINKLSTTSDTNTFTYTFNLASSNKTFQKYQFQANNSQILVLDANGSEFFSDVEIKDTQYLTYTSGTANQFLKLDVNKKMVSTTLSSSDLSNDSDLVKNSDVRLSDNRKNPNPLIAGSNISMSGDYDGSSQQTISLASISSSDLSNGNDIILDTDNRIDKISISEDATGDLFYLNFVLSQSGRTNQKFQFQGNSQQILVLDATGSDLWSNLVIKPNKHLTYEYGTAGKFLKLDANKKMVTTTDDPVLTTGTQSIAGEKTFTSKLAIGDTNKTTFLADNDVVIEKEGTTFGFWGGKGTTSQGTNYRFYGTDNAINYFTIDTTQQSKHYIKSTAGTLGFDNLNIETNGWFKLNSGTAHQWVKLDEYNKLVTDTLSVSDITDNNTLVKTDDVRIDKISTTSTTNPHEFKYIFDLSSTNKTYQTYEFKGNNNLIAVFSEITNMFYSNIELFSTKHFTYGYGTANKFLKLDANKKMVTDDISTSDLSDGGDIVMDTGNQTIAGVKTFSNDLKVGSSDVITFPSDSVNDVVIEKNGNMKFWGGKGSESGCVYYFTGNDSNTAHIQLNTSSNVAHYLYSSTGVLNFYNNNLRTTGSINTTASISSAALTTGLITSTGGSISFGTNDLSIGGDITYIQGTTGEFLKLGSGKVVESSALSTSDLSDSGDIVKTSGSQSIAGAKTFTDTMTVNNIAKNGVGMSLRQSGIPIIMGDVSQSDIAENGTIAAFVAPSNNDSLRVLIRNTGTNNALLKFVNQNKSWAIGATGSNFGLYDYANGDYKLLYNGVTFNFKDRNITTTGSTTTEGFTAGGSVRMKQSYLGSSNIPAGSVNEFRTILKPTDFIGDDDSNSQYACMHDSLSSSLGYPASFGGVRIDAYSGSRPDLTCQCPIPYGATALSFRINLKNFNSTSATSRPIGAYMVTTSITDDYVSLNDSIPFYTNVENSFSTGTLSSREWSANEDRLLMFIIEINSTWNTIQGGFVRWTI